MKTLRTLWMRLTQHSGEPGDSIPWYAPPLMAVFVVGAYVLMSTLDKAGF